MVAHPPRTLPAWRAPEPKNRVARRAVVRPPRRTSAPAAARATTRPRSTSASRRRRSPATTPSSRRTRSPSRSCTATRATWTRSSTARSRSSSRHRPYFAGKQYEEELERDGVPSSYVEYLQLLTDVFAECARKLEPGGRIAVNVANLGRKPYRSLAADVVRILQDDLQLLLRGEVVWRKGEGAAGSCAWGSFRSAANPVLRDTTERVVIASKGRFDRAQSRAERERRGLPSVNTIDADEFMAATLDVWDIQPESARRVSHPAPFPVELPGRLIDLYTYENDLVLDPFMGSGSTLVAAARLGRRFVGYDLDPTYVDIARLRVRDEGSVHRAPSRPPNAPEPTTVDRPTTSRPARPRKARPRRHSPRSCSIDTGFKIVAKNQRLRGTGVTINFIATDADERRVVLRRVGRVHEHTRRTAPHRHGVEDARARACAARRACNGPLVFLTSHLPRKGSEGDRRAHATSPSRADSSTRSRCAPPTGYERLRKYAAGGHSEVPLSGFLA